MKLIALAVFVACLGFARAEGPFADLSFDAATAKARDEGKLLMVDFTASWCPPCKMMDKQTWPDADVQAWIRRHAIAIQVDIDKEPELAQRFGFQAIPTVIFLKDDKELDRHTGFRTPAQLISWGDDVLAGKDSKTAALDKGKSLLESSEVDARYDAARELLQAGEYELALQHFLWLWPNTREASGYGGVRLSYMLSDMARLAGLHEPARKAFAGLLEDLQGKIDASKSPSFDDWQEWTSMCQYFDERGRVVAWYEKHRDGDGRLKVEASAGFLSRIMIDEVFDVLIAAERPVDAVRLYGDVSQRGQSIVDDYTQGIGSLERMPEELREGLRGYHLSTCRGELATLRAAALAAGQTDAAAKLAQQLLGVLDDADSRVMLVSASLHVAPGQTAGLAAWLDEAEKLGADVGELRAQLATPASAEKSKDER